MKASYPNEHHSERSQITNLYGLGNAISGAIPAGRSILESNQPNSLKYF